MDRSQIFLKGPYKKSREEWFRRVCSDWTRGNGFKLQEDRFRIRIRKKILHYDGGETLKEVTLRSSGCPIPGVHGQVWWGFDEPGLVLSIPARGRWVGTKLSWIPLLTPAIPWFNEKQAMIRTERERGQENCIIAIYADNFFREL